MAILICIAKIARPHGIKGALRIKLEVDTPEVLELLSEFYISENEQPLNSPYKTLNYIRCYNRSGNAVLIVNECKSIEEAEKYRNYTLWVYKHKLPQLEDGIYYIYQLMGLEVITDTGEKLGKVTDIYLGVANEVIEVNNDILLPSNFEVIKSVNLEEGFIIVHLLEGLV